MSADNWCVCPKCKVNVAKKKAETLRKAQETYGKVPAEEYERMIASARIGVKKNDNDTLREDYELGMREDGTFWVSYYASCQKCEFKYQFKDEHKVDLEKK